MPGWSYYATQNGYHIYQNDYFIPMGFTYDSYMTRTKYDGLSQNIRELSLLKAIVLEDKDAENTDSISNPLMKPTSIVTPFTHRKSI